MRVAFSALLAEERPFLGTFVQSAAPEFVEAAGYAGFRFVAVDLEHTYYGPEKTAEMVRAGEAADLCVLARVPVLDAVWIKKCLDMGASGVIVPNVDNAAQAAEAVRLCRFAPEGGRGACPGVRANRYGAGGTEYYAKANREVVVIPLWSPRRGCGTSRRSSERRGSPQCSWGRWTCRWPWAGAGTRTTRRCGRPCWT